MILERDDKTMKVVNKDGVVKRIAFATDAQFNYLNNLRHQLGKKSLKGKPTVYAAKKQIDTTKKKLEELKAKPQQTSILGEE
jgi:hypothetical protein